MDKLIEMYNAVTWNGLGVFALGLVAVGIATDLSNEACKWIGQKARALELANDAKEGQQK